MSATSNLAKDAWDHLPYLKDQGIPNVVGTPGRGVSIQSFQTTMPAGGVIPLPQSMANAGYQVLVHNHDGANHGTAPTATRRVTQFTLVGPTPGELLDVMVVGQLKGQLG
jgi:hypothetical protein